MSQMRAWLRRARTRSVQSLWNFPLAPPHVHLALHAYVVDRPAKWLPIEVVQVEVNGKERIVVKKRGVSVLHKLYAKNLKHVDNLHLLFFLSWSEMMGYITSLSCSQFLRLATDSIYAPNFVIFLSQQSQSCYL